MEYSKPLKTISKIIPTSGKHWVGDGFNVRPLFDNYAFTEVLSPFLMFDYAEPKMFPPTKKRLGVGQHPHRGFSTVTIAFQGEVEHGQLLGSSRRQFYLRSSHDHLPVHPRSQGVERPRAGR